MVGGGLLTYLAFLAANTVDPRFLRQLFGPHAGSLPPWVLFPLIFPLLLLTAILVHEGGHVVGGLTAGFRFLFLVVGPLRIERTERGHIALALNRSLALVGGIAACIPRDSHNLPRRFAWMIAAGPLASLLVALALGTAAYSMHAPNAFHVMSAVLALFSFAIGLVTIIPMRTGMFLSDGARLLQLSRGDSAARRDAALLSIIAADQSGVPVHEWNRDTVLALLTPADASVFERTGRLLAYMWALANGAVGDGRAQLERAATISEGLPPIERAWLDNEMAFMRALYDRTGTGEASMPAPAALTRVPAYSRARTAAALAAANGDHQSTRRQLDLARSALASGTAAKTGGGQWELDRLAEIEREIAAS